MNDLIAVMNRLVIFYKNLWYEFVNLLNFCCNETLKEKETMPKWSGFDWSIDITIFYKGPFVTFFFSLMQYYLGKISKNKYCVRFICNQSSTWKQKKNKKVLKKIICWLMFLNFKYSTKRSNYMIIISSYNHFCCCCYLTCIFICILQK